MSEDLGSNLDDEPTINTDAPPPPPRGKGKAAVAAPRAPAETVEIILEENDDIPPTGLFVGVNGRGFLIQAGEKVRVPLSVKEVLDNAVMSRPQLDPQTKQVLGYRDQMRYPYRLV